MIFLICGCENLFLAIDLMIGQNFLFVMNIEMEDYKHYLYLLIISVISQIIANQIIKKLDKDGF